VTSASASVIQMTVAIAARTVPTSGARPDVPTIHSRNIITPATTIAVVRDNDNKLSHS
jgi:hypothetical protein